MKPTRRWKHMLARLRRQQKRQQDALNAEIWWLAFCAPPLPELFTKTQ